jgi:hypothetical protein
MCRPSIYTAQIWAMAPPSHDVKLTLVLMLAPMVAIASIQTRRRDMARDAGSRCSPRAQDLATMQRRKPRCGGHRSCRPDPLPQSFCARSSYPSQAALASADILQSALPCHRVVRHRRLAAP